MIGQTISHYQILERLGSGGMGEVYLARDTGPLDRRVALKFIRRERDQDPMAQQRFLQEARAAAALDHPYLCKIYEIGEEQGAPFIAMEYVVGETLQDRLERKGFGVEEGLIVAQEILEALHKAHSEGIVHRDLKPANVIVAPDGHVKVMDFGLAKSFRKEEAPTADAATAMTQPGERAGTPLYMSPEQISAHRVDHRSDLFSFGVLLYEILTGAHPFKCDSTIDTTSAILSHAPEPLASYGREAIDLFAQKDKVQTLLNRCLQKHPDDRYQNAKVLRRDLRDLILSVQVAKVDSQDPGPAVTSDASQLGTSLSADTTGRESRPEGGWWEQIRAPRWIATAAALLLLAGFFWWTTGDSPSSLTRAPDFQEGNWLLLSGFENRTGDSSLDGILEHALERELGDSPFVRVVPRGRIEDSLRLMRKPPDTPIDESLGIEVCLRDGEIPALLTGRLETRGSAYSVSLQLVDPREGISLVGTVEQAEEREELLEVAGPLADWIRQSLGEKLLQVRPAEKAFQKVTTDSLRALKLYSEAFPMAPRGPAEELYRQVINLDPKFASAHIMLAWCISNQGRPAEEYLPHAQRAFELVDSATDRERYFIRGSYFQMTEQLEKARHAYEALIRLDPDHGWGKNNLRKIYYEANQVRDAVRMRVKAADARPNDLRANRRAVLDLAGQLGELDQAQVYSERAIGLLPSQISHWVELQVALFPAREHWMEGNVERALEIVEQVSTKLPPASSRSGLIDFNLGTMHLDLGRLREAREFLERASRDNDASVTVLTLISQKPNELRTHLNRLNNGHIIPFQAILMARMGIRPDPSKLPRGGSARFALDVVQGEIELAGGKQEAGERLLQDALEPATKLAYHRGTFALAAESLAKLWSRQGKPEQAIEVLEECTDEKEKVRVAFSLRWAPLWMRLRLQLAGLHRQVGDVTKAQVIEAELERMLAVADRDHPFLYQLEQLRGK